MSKVKKTAASDKKQQVYLEGDSARRVHTEGDLARSDLENQLRRALADYQNLERRVSEERTLLGRLTSVLVIEKFLPILDNLESAQSHLNDEGLALVIKQFRDVLASEGVEELETEGQEFNPHMHEAVEAVDGDKDNVIVKEVSKGYKIEDRVIRPAKVVVSRKTEAANVQNQSGNQVEENIEGGTVDSL